MKKFSIIIFVTIAAAIIVWYFLNQNAAAPPEVKSFADCVAAGNPIMESYPRQCRHDGKIFVEDIGNEREKSDLIRLFEPRPGSVIASPLTIKGEARGAWFFEASFPVRLLDGEGREIAIKPAEAQNEWMTEEFVPFALTLEFEAPDSPNGVLILEKDNPSGLPEHADELRVPIKFEDKGNEKGEMGKAECFPTGCSGQVCADKEVITTCEFRPEYACFKNARCERQRDGQCGWTPSNELQSCLSQHNVSVDGVRALY